VLLVDDVKPGVDRANVAGVDVVAAGWSHGIPSIRDFIQAACVAYGATVPGSAEFILK
jgi:phosphoglycolate phosphatase/pyrophosphatase PpaX